MDNEKLAKLTESAELSIDAARAIEPLHNERVVRVEDGSMPIVVLERWKGNETGRGLRFVTLEIGRDVNADFVRAWVVKSNMFLPIPSGPISAKTGYGQQVI